MEETTVVAGQLGHDFSVIGMFMQADPVVKAVMLGLALASVWTWAVIIEKSLTFSRLKAKAKRFEDAFWSGKPLDDLYRRTQDRADHPMAKVFVAGMGEFGRGRTQATGLAPGAQERIDKVMRVTVDRELERVERQLPVLATIGSAAPFIGLFGTVWGIMNSFQGIAATGDASLAVVAPGIAEALFATAIGLVAAIPAVIGYNRYSTAANAYATRLESFAGEFSALLSRQLDGAR
jgi:biopolymer transport protein TolQ